MAELTAYLKEHLSGFQQYDDEMVRQLVRRIPVVDMETMHQIPIQQFRDRTDHVLK